MKVSGIRFGEVQIKKQGTKGKNNWDKTRSFSIEETSTNYSLEQYRDILELVTNLSEKIEFEDLKNKLEKIKNQ